MTSFILLCWFILPQKACFGFSMFCYFVFIGYLLYFIFWYIDSQTYSKLSFYHRCLKKLGFAYFEFIFLDVLVFFFSGANFVDVCFIFLLNCGSSLLPETLCVILSIFVTMEKSCKSCWHYSCKTTVKNICLLLKRVFRRENRLIASSCLSVFCMHHCRSDWMNFGEIL